MALKKSAGFAFLWKDEILLSHPTGAPWVRTYSIIKGGVEPNENLLEAAIREVKEETGIVVSDHLLAQVKNQEPLVVQNATKVLTTWFIRINDPSEIGMEVTEDYRHVEHIIIDKKNLQQEEIDWAGFIRFNDAGSRIAPYQWPILNRAKEMLFEPAAAVQPISKAAQDIIRPEWEKMQEFLKETAPKVTIELFSAENNVRDYNIKGHPRIYHIKMSNRPANGDMVNVYFDDSSKGGIAWRGTIEKVIEDFDKNGSGFFIETDSEKKKPVWQIRKHDFVTNMALLTDAFKSYPKEITDNLKIVSVYQSPTGGTNEFDLTKPTPVKAIEYAKIVHEYLVQQALNAGEPVPAEVLKDYPKMKKMAPEFDILTEFESAKSKIEKFGEEKGQGKYYCLITDEENPQLIVRKNAKRSIQFIYEEERHRTKVDVYSDFGKSDKPLASAYIFGNQNLAQEIFDHSIQFLNQDFPQSEIENSKSSMKKQYPILDAIGSDIRYGFTPEAEKFVPYHQLEFLKELDKEGNEEYIDVFDRINKIVAEMPQTYKTKNIPFEEKTIYLHYFYPNGDWYILEKDKGSSDDAKEDRGKQFQAFGIANLNGLPMRRAGVLVKWAISPLRNYAKYHRCKWISILTQ